MEHKLEKVNFLGQYLAASRSVEETLEMAMIISQDVLGYDHAMIRLLEGETLKAVKWIGFPREAANMVIRVGEGISGIVAKTGEPALVMDTLDDPRFLSGVEGCRSELCVPMIYNTSVVGVFNVESNEPEFFTEQDLRILQTLSLQITSAMETTRLREKLSGSEKLSFVGQFASSILHDIRNDIHQLQICSDLLRKPNPSPERIEMVSQTVKKAGENIYGMIEDVLEFVRTERSRLDREKIRLGPFIDSIINKIHTKASNSGVSLAVETDESIELDIDHGRFGRAILNLVNNSIEAMPYGGELSIVSCMNGRDVSVELRDTGAGIEKDRIDKIWEPFYTYGKKKGTGLGMAIVKKIIEEHGFTINVQSTLGAGTCVTITATPAKP